MGRFDFASPGAEAVEGITKVLARRKAEERQNLLDSLTVKADERAAAEAVAQQQVREAQLRQMDLQNQVTREQQDRLKYEQIANNLDLGTEASKANLKPADVDLIGKYGGWSVKAAPPANTSGVTDAASASDVVANTQGPSMVFVGTRDQRERQRRLDESGKIIARMATNPKTAKWADAAAMSAANNDGKISDEILAMLGPDVDVSIFDEPSGRFKSGGTISRGAQVVTRGWSPNYNTGANRREWIPHGVNSDGYVVFVNGNGQTKVGDVQIANPRGAASLGISQPAIDSHMATLGGLQEVGTGFLGYGEAKIPEANLIMFRQSANNLIQQAKTTAKVKQLAGVFVKDINEFQKALAQTANLTPDEGGQLKVLTDAIASPELQEVLKRYGFKAPAAKATPTPAAPLTGLERSLMKK
jgi:hypothetical protein